MVKIVIIISFYSLILTSCLSFELQIVYKILGLTFSQLKSKF